MKKGGNLVSFLCPVEDILCFLQSLFNEGRAYSTIKGYVAAISACHVGFKTGTVGEQALVRLFMRGVYRKRPTIKNVAPKWDLSMVLDALTKAPFEPLDSIDIKYLSYKTAILVR